MEAQAGGQPVAVRSSRPREIWGALALLVLTGILAGSLGTTRAVFDATVVNGGSTYGTTSVYSPTGLTISYGNCTGPCFGLNWTPPASNNGNGYAISGMNNGTNPTCPATAAAYTTYVGSTASTSFNDSGTVAQGLQGTYACYLVRSGYSASGPAPWAGLPTWTSADTLPTVSIRLGILEIQAGPTVAAASGNSSPTLNAASAAGSLLIFFGWNDSTTGFSASPGWQLATRVNDALGWTEMWFYPANPGAMTGDTFTSDGVNSFGQMSEFGGVYGTSPLDATGTASVATATSATVATSAATTTTGQLAVSFFNNDLSGGAGSYSAPPNGWTNIYTDNPNGADSDYQLTGSPAVISERATFSVTVNWSVLIATFKGTRYGIQLVQAGTNIASSGSGSVTPTLAAASTAGNLLVFTGWNSSCATCGFSGPAGWVRANRRYNPWWGEIWYYASNPGGITSAAFTSTGANSGGQLSEYAGVSALDTTGVYNTTGNATSATVTTTGATAKIGELAVAFFRHNGGGTFGAPSGWINLVNDGTNGVLSNYMVVGSTATVSERATSTLSRPWVAVLATFK